MKNWLRIVIAMLIFSVVPSTIYASPPGQMVVPLDKYRWIQSSERMNYFFEYDKIVYGIDEEGKINFNLLTVPTLKSYDGIKVTDVIQKRRWREKETDGFELLAGEAVLLEFNLLNKTVEIKNFQYLTFQRTVLEEITLNKVIEIEKLPEKSYERRFYEGILNFEKGNGEHIIANTRGGNPKKEDLKRLAKIRKAEEKEENADSEKKEKKEKKGKKKKNKNKEK